MFTYTLGYPIQQIQGRAKQQDHIADVSSYQHCSEKVIW